MALLLAVLGIGLCWAPAVAAQAAPTAPAATASASVAAPGHDGSGDDRPGCGRGGKDGLEQPARPPRQGSAHELLPAPAEAHGGGGHWCGDQAFLDLTPVRGPPELVALSPVDLSVLRV